MVEPHGENDTPLTRASEPVLPFPKPPWLRGEAGIKAALVFAAAFLLVIAGLICYLNGFSIPFYEEELRLIQPPGEGHIGALAGQGLLPSFSFAITRWAAGDDVRVYRGFNIALHLATAVCVFLLARRVFRRRIPEPAALVAGMLFALHPGVTETVNYLPARGNLLASAFIVAAVLLYLRATQDRDDVGVGVLCLSVGCFFAAWGSHERAILVPALILAADWVANDPASWRRRFLTCQTPFWASLAGMMTVHFAGRPVDVSASGASAPSLIHQAEAFMQYLWFTVTGRGLSVVHAQPSLPGPQDPSAMIAFAVLAACAVIALALTQRRLPLGLALLWFTLALLPNSLLPDPEPVLSDHRLYLALAGIVLAAPWLLTTAPLREGIGRKAVGAAVVVLLAAAGVGTFVRNGAWAVPLTLWTEAAQAAPDSAYVQQRLGNIYLQQGGLRMLSLAQNIGRLDAATQDIHLRQARELYAKAEEHFRNADHLESGNPDTLFHLGGSLEGQQKLDEAIEVLVGCLHSDLEKQEAAIHLAGALQARAAQNDSQEDLVRALDYYRYAESLRPIPPALLSGYGSALLSLGEIESAYAVFSKVAEAQQEATGHPPEAESPQTGQLDLLKQSVEYLGAMRRQIEELRTAEPHNVKILLLEGELLAARRQFLRAAYNLEAYLSTAPDEVRAWVLLGFVKGAQGTHQRFLEEWPAPPTTSSEDPSPWILLAQNCAMHGRWDLGLEYLGSRQAAAQVPYPLVSAAEVALSLRQLTQARDFLRQASEAYPDSPLPWLRLCDIAMGSNDFTTARGYLAEAEKRNADPNEIASRKEKLEATGKEGRDQAPITVLR